MTENQTGIKCVFSGMSAIASMEIGSKRIHVGLFESNNFYIVSIIEIGCSLLL